jgi:DHA1 family inner membrane transport protein
MGMLPVIAAGVDVSIPSAGLLVSAYAVGVMIGAPVMTLVFSRFGKRSLWAISYLPWRRDIGRCCLHV